MTDGGAHNNSVDTIAIALSIGQPFEYDHAAAFGTDDTVRVFVGGSCSGCGGKGTAAQISSEYARNVADFLRRAKRSGQFVILTTQWLPDGYAARIGEAPFVDDVNRIYQPDVVPLRVFDVLACGAFLIAEHSEALA